jgi:hypothetical protein
MVPKSDDQLGVACAAIASNFLDIDAYCQSIMAVCRFFWVDGSDLQIQRKISCHKSFSAGALVDFYIRIRTDCPDYILNLRWFTGNLSAPHDALRALALPMCGAGRGPQRKLPIA